MEERLGSKETVCFKFENNDLKVIFPDLRHLNYCKIDLTSLAMNSICEKSTWKSTLNFGSSFDLNFIKMSTKCMKHCILLQAESWSKDSKKSEGWSSSSKFGF